MTASNRSDSVYFHLENTFSVGGVAEDGSGEQGVVVWKGLRQVSLSHVNVLLQGFFTVPDCREPNFIFRSLNLISPFRAIKKNLFQICPLLVLSSSQILPCK